MSATAERRLRGAATAFIDECLAGGHVAFPLSDLVREAGLSVTAAKSQLRRLGRRVVRISRLQGFFLIVNPEHQPLGAPPVEWWLDDYFRWLGHPYYMGLQSAAGVHGSNSQAVQVTQVITDSPRRELAVGRKRVRFFVKHNMAHTPVQEPSDAFAPLRVSAPEATAFDLVRYASSIGGIGRVAETLAPLLPQMRGHELMRVIALEKETSTAQRLGYLLETLGSAKLADIIHAWLPLRPAWIPLALAGVGRPSLPGNERWRILDNVGNI